MHDPDCIVHVDLRGCLSGYTFDRTLLEHALLLALFNDLAVHQGIVLLPDVVGITSLRLLLDGAVFLKDTW